MSEPLKMKIGMDEFKRLQETAPMRRVQKTDEDYIAFLKDSAYTAHAIAESFGLKVSTVKSRLKKLCDQGRIERRVHPVTATVFYAIAPEKAPSK